MTPQIFSLCRVFLIQGTLHEQGLWLGGRLAVRIASLLLFGGGLGSFLDHCLALFYVQVLVELRVACKYLSNVLIKSLRRSLFGA